MITYFRFLVLFGLISAVPAQGMSYIRSLFSNEPELSAFAKEIIKTQEQSTAFIAALQRAAYLDAQLLFEKATAATAGVIALIGASEMLVTNIRGGGSPYSMSPLLFLGGLGTAIPSSILAYVALKSGINDLRK